jgi:hypothetical protein
LDALQPEAEALLYGERRLHTVTRIPIPYTDTERQPAIAADAKAEEPLFEVVTAVFAMSIV